MRTIAHSELAFVSPSFIRDPIALTIILNDFLLWGTGIAIGIILAILVIPSFLNKVYITPRFEDNSDLEMVTVIDKKTGDECHYINPRTKRQTTSLIIAYLVWRVIPTRRKKSSYKLYDDAITKAIYYSVVGVLVMMTSLGLLSIVTIIYYVK